MSSTTRSLQRTWTSAYETAPPTACSTLRNYRSVIEWGYTCTFSEEEDDASTSTATASNFPINTACMPWVTPGIYPATDAFYSPATACPDAWTAVSTSTAGTNQWIDGETAIICCPSGFEGNGSGGCQPGSSGVWPVVECGDADEEENESRTYSGAAWPTGVTNSIIALELRHQATDLASNSQTASGSGASNTSGLPTSTGAVAGNGTANGNGSGGLTTGAKAAIGTVVPVTFLLGALACYLLWRRRRARNAASGEERGDGHGAPEVAYAKAGSMSPTSPTSPSTVASKPIGATGNQAETPEWNAEMDARETERYRAYQPPRSEAISGSGDAATAVAGGEIPANNNAPSELAGMARKARKPLPVYEIDGTERSAELSGGDRSMDRGDNTEGT